jgi:enoyl-CoA hydratase
MHSEDLIVSRAGRLGSIRLNRPKALNSLTLHMVRGFAVALDHFGADDEIYAVLVTGEGERGFCAGGDIRALYELGESERGLFKTFWREEYALNARIASFPKPYVVLMDGVVMGGGVGISAHGNRRIVTERTRVAMPEVGIGFLPDVGGTWLLSRAGDVGTYMALSGTAVAAADAIDAGLADVIVAVDDIRHLTERLGALRSVSEVDAILGRFAQRPEVGSLQRQKALLASTMRHERVEVILDALEREGSDFALRARADIAAKSPTSLKLTHALLKRGAIATSVETCLANEFRAVCRMLSVPDLYEGIRAAIIDKDHNPQWSPKTLQEVSEATVAGILAGDGTPEPSFKPWSGTPYPSWAALG